MIQINNISKYLLNVDISEKEIEVYYDGIEHGDYPLRDRVVVVFNLLKHYLEDGAKVLMLDVGIQANPNSAIIPNKDSHFSEINLFRYYSRLFQEKVVNVGTL
ncbi:MAG: hypothetical protein ACI87N_001300 [Flavobacteriales bacterium]|jgi:hypothetical protein